MSKKFVVGGGSLPPWFEFECGEFPRDSLVCDDDDLNVGIENMFWVLDGLNGREDEPVSVSLPTRSMSGELGK
jgi:hypothetical protein